MLTSFISNGGIPGGALTVGCHPCYLIGQINTGQADGTPGLDLNVAEAWQLGYTGKGVIIAIMDDGEHRNKLSPCSYSRKQWLSRICMALISDNN